MSIDLNILKYIITPHLLSAQLEILDIFNEIKNVFNKKIEGCTNRSEVEKLNCVLCVRLKIGVFFLETPPQLS